MGGHLDHGATVSRTAAPQPADRPPGRDPRAFEASTNQTVRMIARTSIGGRRLRIVPPMRSEASRWPWARRISPFAQGPEIVAGVGPGAFFQRQTGLYGRTGMVILSDRWI